MLAVGGNSLPVGAKHKLRCKDADDRRSPSLLAVSPVDKRPNVFAVIALAEAANAVFKRSRRDQRDMGLCSNDYVTRSAIIPPHEKTTVTLCRDSRPRTFRKPTPLGHLRRRRRRRC